VPPLKAVLDNLPKLSNAELNSVRQRLSFLLGGEGKAKPVTNDWLLEGITSELRRRGLWMKAYPLPQKLMPDGYADKAAFVREYLIKGCGADRLKSVELLVLGQVATGALADYLKRAKTPVSPKTLLSNVDKIPAALDAAFPGYWTAGALSVCATTRR